MEDRDIIAMKDERDAVVSVSCAMASLLGGNISTCESQPARRQGRNLNSFVKQFTRERRLCRMNLGAGELEDARLSPAS